MNPQLVHASDFDQLAWPADPDSVYARDWLTFVGREGTKAAIANAHVEVQALVWPEAVLPVTVTHGDLETCYVAGPYANFIAYAEAELFTIKQAAVRGGIRVILSGLGTLLRFGDINRIAIANNYMLSTNLYPALDRAQIEQAATILRDAHPGHAVAFRSVADVGNRPMVSAFRDAGFVAVPSRQVWWQDPRDGLSRNARKCLKRDFKRLEQGPYRVVGPDELTESDLPRLLWLYNQLYLEKYTPLNPQFTLAFLTHAWRDRLLYLQALRHEETGSIDGIMGCFWRNGMLTTPLFGYDLSLPQEVGLYRMLAALVYREAEKRHLVAHCSSGAAEFKRSRGAQPAIEYLMVDIRHLGARQRWVWKLLSRLFEGIAVPVMQRYEL
ncbi:MAG: GNAT family N-acetyltransferase [Candidatus Sericytochromatia bacterium]|nr:GNAT family N-acetyltransferase [Candidatus Sericytochromatia bacterium]